MTGDAADLALLFAASIAAGGVNAIAGGGTILTFAVLSAILPAGPERLVTANVTSKIGLWPGAAAAAWACRREWAKIPAWARWLVLPSTAGAVLGVVLLQTLPSAAFDAVVPWLILMAAVLFTIQPHVTRLVVQHMHGTNEQYKPLAPAWGPRVVGPSRLQSASGSVSDPHSPGLRRGLVWGGSAPLVLVHGLQLLVGIYGGYFGAGIGILMLAVLALLSLGDIHAINAVKNLLAASVNGIATLLLVIASLTGGFEIWWLYVAVTAIGSILGGIAVAKLSRQLPATAIRRLVAIIAFALAGYYLWKEFS